MLVLLRTFMDMAPLIIITTPIFLPMSMNLGMDPVHFGIMLILNVGIGLVTSGTIWPFYLALLIALALVIHVPATSLCCRNC